MVAPNHRRHYTDHEVEVRAGHKDRVQYDGASGRLTHDLCKPCTLYNVAVRELI
jgi:hypothetical protein